MQAYTLLEGEILVRGTADPGEAARFILEHGWEDLPWFEDDIGILVQGREPHPWVEMAKESIATWVYNGARNPERTGYFRFNVQPESSDYGWTLGYMDGPGRGNFPGVLFHAP